MLATWSKIFWYKWPERFCVYIGDVWKCSSISANSWVGDSDSLIIWSWCGYLNGSSRSQIVNSFKLILFNLIWYISIQMNVGCIIKSTKNISKRIWLRAIPYYKFSILSFLILFHPKINISQLAIIVLSH